MKLTDIQVKNIKPAGKQKTLSLGQYPAISLKAAREKLDQAKELLAQGVTLE